MAATVDSQPGRPLGVHARWSVAGAIALLFSAIAFPVSAQGPVDGGLQVEEHPFGRFGSSVTARMVVNAAPQQAYRILADHDHLAEFMPLVEESRFLGERAGKAVVRFHIRYLGWIDITEVDERTLVPFRRIDWKAIEGPLKVSDGAWTFQPVRGGTSLTYQTIVDPGIPVPAWLTAKILKDGLPAFMEAVRLRIESGGRWRKAR